MIQRIPLSKCKLWWPAWQQGIPFTSYGYANEVTGEGYRFRVDPEMDSWLCENGDLMPICTSKLEAKDIGVIKYTSFTVQPGGIVQVNLKVDGPHAYRVVYYALEELTFVGDTYSLDE